MSITLILVIITCATSIYAWNNQHIMQKWILNPYMVRHRNQYYRFITSGVIHANWMHLIFNMLVLWMFGEQVEWFFTQVHGNTLGPILFVVMYLLGIVISDIPTYVKNKENIYYNSLGASGGTAAILFSFILFQPMSELCLYGLLCLPGVIWGGLYIIYSIYMGKQQMDNINHDAHLWGALFGIIFTIVMWPKVVLVFFDKLTI